MIWEIKSLEDKYSKESFDCGEPALNTYLKQYASQHAKSKLSKTFVALLPDETDKIVGYYTLSAGSIRFEDLPMDLQKKLPRYPIPITRIGRLAVEQSMQRQGLGRYLLMDALYRCVNLSEGIGIVGVVVDAKHDKAKSFYQHYGFTAFTELPLTMFISIQTILVSIKK